MTGEADADGLIKPKAYVILQNGQHGTDELRHALQDFIKGSLEPYKYPRWVEFVDDLPKTVTGKIQRFRLRKGNS